ncbi:hypothetical protein [Bacillus sp. 2205SS5-2]|uniref:hypothetical protein n=1 Tax=Bacillus sp. 2205SS5-2 TaxID=3109031 RepID=UPI003003E1E1
MQRYLLCLLLAGVMMYYAAPRLTLSTTNTEGIFSITWIAFALLVIAGNLSALLFSSTNSEHVKKTTRRNRREQKMKSLG